jgi:hypothetical protein
VIVWHANLLRILAIIDDKVLLAQAMATRPNFFLILLSWVEECFEIGQNLLREDCARS